MPKAKDVFALVLEVLPEDIDKPTKPVVREVIESFGQGQLDELTADDVFNMQDPQVTRYLRQYSSTRIKDINNTTRRSLRRSLAKGVEAGETTDQLAKRVRHTFRVADKSRSLTIARTEVGRASNFGSLKGMQQAGVEGKEWLATQDGLVRDSHKRLNGDVVGIDEYFRSGRHRAQYPGGFGVPAEDINCRCGILPVLSEEEDAYSAPVMKARWTALEKSRAPWDRKLTARFRQGFRVQRDKVLASLSNL